LRSLYPLRPILYTNDMIILCNALILPLINYMAIAWGTANKQDLKIIEGIIRATGRMLFKKSKCDSVKLDIVEHMKWLFPKKMYESKILLFTHSVVNETCPPYFLNYFKFKQNIHNHNTRNDSQLFNDVRVNNKYGNRILSRVAYDLWKELPIYIREIEEVKSFKSNLIAYLQQDQICEAVMYEEKRIENVCNLSCIEAAITSDITVEEIWSCQLR